MKIVIIGGAGFIGSNTAEYYAKDNHEVVIFDNLSRKGSENNLKYLLEKYPDNIKFVNWNIINNFDINSPLYNEMKKSDFILHLAAQVAVTDSVKNPREDFNINALGTLNILEVLRNIKEKTGNNPVFIYSSTNKVYGDMKDIEIIEKEEYEYKHLKGINEKTMLDFHSPYGCSKGAGDQYVRDYSRIYNLNTIVMRQSCIYGERQFGIEDQGWIAWFTIATILKKPITIFGNGKQVRDVLWINDLIKAYDLARQNIEKTKGQIYNIGGGHKNKLSLLKLIYILKELSKIDMNLSYSDWRPGDQKVCIMDITKAQNDFGWQPKTSPEEGVKKLYNWVISNKDEIRNLFF